MPAPHLSAEPRRRRSDQPILASVVCGCHERPCGRIVFPEPSGAEAGLQLHLARNLRAVNPGDHPAVLRTRPRRLLAGDPRLRMGTPAGTDQPCATQPQPLTGVLVETAVALAATQSSNFSHWRRIGSPARQITSVPSRKSSVSPAGPAHK